jgi:hypothetical protein
MRTPLEVVSISQTYKFLPFVGTINRVSAIMDLFRGLPKVFNMDG